MGNGYSLVIQISYRVFPISPMSTLSFLMATRYMTLDRGP